jgi:hypothetical protein
MKNYFILIRQQHKHEQNTKLNIFYFYENFITLRFFYIILMFTSIQNTIC